MAGALWIRIQHVDNRWGDFKRLGKAPEGWKKGDPVPKQFADKLPTAFKPNIPVGSHTAQGPWQAHIKKVKKPKNVPQPFAQHVPIPLAHNKGGKGYGKFPPPGKSEAEWSAMSFTEKMALPPEGATTDQVEAWKKMTYKERIVANRTHFVAQLLAARHNLNKFHNTTDAHDRYMKKDASSLAMRAEQYMGIDKNKPKPPPPPPKPVKAPWAPAAGYKPIEPVAELKEPAFGKWNDSLMACHVVKHKKNVAHGVGNPESYIMTISVKGEQTGAEKQLRGVYKPDVGDDPPKNELAAFLVDRACGINRVPHVIMKEFHLKDGPRAGEKLTGSFMQYCEDPAGPVKEAGEFMGSPDKEEYARIAVLDFLCGNVDRHDRNWMVYPDGKKLAAIDNGRCFYKGGPGHSTYSVPWNNVNHYGNMTIPQDIHDTIKAMDVYKLKADLKAAGISHQHIDNFSERLEHVKASGEIRREWDK